MKWQHRPKYACLYASILCITKVMYFPDTCPCLYRFVLEPKAELIKEQQLKGEESDNAIVALQVISMHDRIIHMNF